jgi:hypothetical protein
MTFQMLESVNLGLVVVRREYLGTALSSLANR